MRRAPPVLLQARTRLACVKHAASVRSEPGSNSRLKLEAWAKKNAPICIGASLPKRIIVARFTQTIRARKAEWFRTDSGTSYRLSKSETLLSSRKASKQLMEYTKTPRKSQHHISDFHSLPHTALRLFQPCVIPVTHSPCGSAPAFTYERRRARRYERPSHPNRHHALRTPRCEDQSASGARVH